MRALFFDTETTGLISSHLLPLKKQPQIIEFYGATVNLATGQIENELDTFVKPSIKITKEITGITHITNEMVENAPPFAKIALNVKALVENAPIVCAHNASYDKEVLQFEFERLGMPIAFPRFICTVEQTIHLKGHRMKLNDLHEYLFGERFEDAHRAKVDTQALIRCAVELYKRGVL